MTLKGMSVICDTAKRIIKRRIKDDTGKRTKKLHVQAGNQYKIVVITNNTMADKKSQNLLSL